MFAKTCPQCSTEFSAARRDKRFCSDTCRANSHKGVPPRPARAEVVPIVASDDDSVYSATVAELDEAGVTGTAAGRTAIAIARRIDGSASESASGLAALARQLADTMSVALKSARKKADPVDDLRMRRDAKRAVG